MTTNTEQALAEALADILANTTPARAKRLQAAIDQVRTTAIEPDAILIRGSDQREWGTWEDDISRLSDDGRHDSVDQLAASALRDALRQTGLPSLHYN